MSAVGGPACTQNTQIWELYISKLAQPIQKQA